MIRPSDPNWHPIPRALAGIASMVCVGCASASAPAPVYGTFASTGGLLGAWNKIADFCTSGVDQSVAFGTNTTVWFSQRSRGRYGMYTSFQLATGAINGKIVRVSVQRGDPFRQIELRPEACARFEVQQRPQPDGTLGADVELDCDTGDGGRVVASIHAPSCR